MATPEALVKYYDCLRESFNKIQVKDNKTALVNAALRPKICEEFDKSKEVLKSYLNYIQVFTLVYSDKFTNICMNIICPIFKEHSILLDSADAHSDDGIAKQVHETIREILKSRPELAEEYINSVIKFFPTASGTNNEIFQAYFSNCLKICSYINGAPLVSMIVKILDRLIPVITSDQIEDEVVNHIKQSIDQAYKLIYQSLNILDLAQKEEVASAILAAFTREFLTSDNGEQLNYLLLYVCSYSPKLTDLFTNLLWKVFTDAGRQYEERRSSACFISSFLARANYVDLDKVFDHLRIATSWCESLLLDNHAQNDPTDSFNETIELFHDLVQSILYLISQRYREMYEEESMSKLNKLNLGKIISSHLKPMDSCEFLIRQRFFEIATLYRLDGIEEISMTGSSTKRRKSGIEHRRGHWKAPFEETSVAAPDLIKPLYRNYYNHRNFTIFRE